MMDEPVPRAPAPRSGPNGWLIALAIIVGVVFSCALLPLGTLALLFSAGGSSSTSLGPLPPTSWEERIIEGSGSNKIVLIEVSGAIGLGGGDLFSTQLSQEALLSQIRQAANDPRVVAVVVRVDSPGGGVVASSEIHAELLKLRESGKRLVVSMGSQAASGGYYISTPAELIYANPDTLTGSLGVILSTLNYADAFEQLGLRTFVYKSGELKDIGSPTREPTAEEQAVLQSIVNEAYEGFVRVIAEGRNMPPERVRELADGRLYTGSQAQALGLVDELGNLDAAIAGAKDLADVSTATVVRYTSSSSLRSLLISQLATPQQPADPLGLRALREPSAPVLEYRRVP
ncbi:MAG: signal peptide peptidase SppA [Oscillochloridaceae bacterium umkhey_bin13]